MKYCIWNNKGGVGKTFLSYNIAVEYALTHTKTSVVVVDMCPQANISEMLLGGNGVGARNLETIHTDKGTISHYIARRLKNPYETSAIGDETKYYHSPHTYNDKMPSNITLIAGSSDLDLYAKGIEFYANSGAMSNVPNAWSRVKSWLKDLLDVYTKLLESNKYTDTVFFIDCNPSFSSYTELALIAADKIIIPCTAEGASVRAIKNVIKIIYGIDADDEFIASFSKSIKESGMSTPKIAMVVQNRNRTKSRKNSESSDKKPATGAFIGVKDEVKSVIRDYLTKHPDIFSSHNKDIVVEVKDCNTIAPIISYNGIAVSKLTAGTTYSVYKKKSSAVKSQIEPFLVDINEIVTRL